MQKEMVLATDISPAAVANCKANASKCGLAGSHLSPGGRVLLGFSETVGNQALLDQRAAEAGAALSVYRTREYSNGTTLAILEVTYP